MKKLKRELSVAVISDVHLGTYGCQARELHFYLQSIKPEILILNGDIIDFWQFSKRYWPKHHMKVVRDIISMAAKGVQIYYITGNHDETMRKFAGLKVGNIEIVNKLELNLDNQKIWVFHGDVFDVLMQHSRWLEKVGSVGYDLLIHLNVVVSFISKLLGKGKVSLSKRIKNNVKTAVKYISSFEHTAASVASRKGFHSIVCGHIHHPEIREIDLGKNGRITYMNSGDWVEHLSALEYHNGEWKIYRYYESMNNKSIQDASEDYQEVVMDMDNKELFKMVMKEFEI